MTREMVIELIGQLIGFVAVMFTVLSFQAKSRGRILLLQTAGSFTWAVHFCLIGTFTSAAMNGLSVVRNLVYAKKDSWRWVRNPVTPSLVIAAVLGLTAFTYEGPVNLLPMAATVISSIAFYLDRERTIRILSLIVSALWFTSNIIEFSIAGICTELFNMTSISIALIRFARRGGKGANSFADGERAESGKNDSAF